MATAGSARDRLSRHLLLDGFDIVLDLERSRGAWLVDAQTGESFLDMFSMFASLPLGMNHPRMSQDDEFCRHLGRIALHKPANSHVPTEEYARFVETFRRVLGDKDLPLYFFIDGGALAVENALKIAFDHADQSGRRNTGRRRGTSRVLHLTGAFHGRSGYTMSLTNTDPTKTGGFPSFDWPRIDTPGIQFPMDEHLQDLEEREERALAQAAEAFGHPYERVACFIAEPIQGEGGDVHLRGEFLQAMQALCREHEALFILDEVQTGVGVTGTAWCHQQLGLEPDLVAFGKKTQVCGVMGGRQVLGEATNAFLKPGRLRSTWGGNLADMVRATRILEIVEAEQLIGHARRAGAYLLERLRGLQATHPTVTNVRGRGLMCALDLPDGQARQAVLRDLFQHERVLMLPAGSRAIRLRPHLGIEQDDLDQAVCALDRSLSRLSAGPHLAARHHEE